MSKFPPGYGYPSRDDWQRIDAQNDRARKRNAILTMRPLGPFYSLRDRLRSWFLICCAIVLAFVVLFGPLLMGRPAHGRDLGQWETSDPAIREWYRGLMQPDAPNTSCCGEADAYWADEVHVRDGRTFATITDDRDDAPLGRPHVDVGTVIEIPPHKLKWDRSNPTGHGVVFLSRGGFVFCYVQPTQG